MSSASHADVVTSLIRLFESETSPRPAQNFITSLHSTTITAIIKSLRDHTLGVCSTALLRALWTSPLLRPTILTTLSELASSSLTSHDTCLLEEIEFLLVRDARNATYDHVHVLKNISICATAIAKHSRESYSSFHGPILIYCARAADAINTTQSHQVRSNILQLLFLSMQSEQLLSLHSVTSLLENEFDMDPEEERMLMNIVLHFVSSQCQDVDYPDVLRAILYNMTKSQSVHRAHVLGWLVFLIIQRSTGDILTDIINVVDLMVIDSEVACDRVSKSFLNVLNYSRRPDVMAHKQVQFSPSHVAILYCLLSDATTEAQQDCLYYILEKILVDSTISFDITDAPSSSSSVTDSDFRRRAVFVESIKVLGVQNRSQTILEFYESLLRKSRKEFHEWGSRMLLELFVWVAESRRSILNVILATLMQADATEYISEAFCSLYERIANTPRSAFALREYRDILKDALGLFALLPSNYDCRVVKASVPIFLTCHNLTDAMLIYLKKAASSRSRKFQIIACTGFLTILEQNTVSDTTNTECCETIRLMIDTSDVAVKSYIISEVLVLMRKKPVCAERMSTLTDIITNKFIMVHENASYPALGNGDVKNTKPGHGREKITRGVSLINCFAHLHGEYMLREPVSILAKFCLIRKESCEKLKEFIPRYAKYLATDDGALLDALVSSRSNVPVLPRVKLLCNVFDALFSTVSDTVTWEHIRAYGLGLIARDYLVSKTIRQDRSDSQSSKRKSNLMLQFASVTTRESAPKLQDLLARRTSVETTYVKGRIRALRRLAVPDDDDQIMSVLKRKISCEILQRFKIELKSWLLEGVDKPRLFSGSNELISIISFLYITNCPWQVSKSFSEAQNRLEDDLAENGVSEEAATSGHGEKSPTWKAEDTKCLSGVYLSTDIRKAVEPDQIRNQRPAMSIDIRHSVLNIFLSLCSHGSLRNALVESIGLLFTGAVSMEDNLLDARVAKVSLSENIDPGQKNDESMKKTEEVTRLLLTIVRLEFANSMSAGLTISYLELLSLMLQNAIRKDGGGYRKVGSMIFIAMTDILREYSIRHVTVLREILKLCLACLERIRAMEFVRGVLVLLGNSPSLLNSHFSCEDMEDGKFREKEFDQDILAEGIALEAGLSEDENRVASPPESPLEVVAAANTEKSTDTETDDFCQTSTKVSGVNSDGNGNQDSARLLSQPRSRIGERSSIKPLCLDETAELGLLSMITIFSYCLKVVSNEVHEHRFLVREERDGMEAPSIGKESYSPSISSILKDFCKTGFAELVSPKQHAWPDALVRKVDYIILGLIECAELKLRLVLRAARCKPSAGCCTHVLDAATRILRNLYHDSATNASVFVIGQAAFRLNRTSVEEKLRATSAELSEMIQEKSEFFDKARIREWSVVMKSLNTIANHSNLARSLGELGNGVSSGMADHARVSHPRKRQRLRSRNSGIDDWLQDEKGDDNFADLEDFIVPMDATDL